MLSAADLTDLRAEISASLPDACLVLRDSYTPDGSGGQTTTTSAVTAVVCRAGPPLNAFQQSEQVAAEKVAVIATGRMVMPYGTDVAEKDRIAYLADTDPDAIAWKGYWSALTAYVADDITAISGKAQTYRCILGNTNHTPPNATYWELLHTLEVALDLEPRSWPLDVALFYRELR